MIKTSIKPYEFLVRWKDGAIAGAHIRFLETISQDGVVLAQKEGNAMPVSLSGEAGFPLADILSAVQKSALVDLENALAAKAEAEAALATTRKDLAAAEASLAAVQEARQ